MLPAWARGQLHDVDLHDVSAIPNMKNLSGDKAVEVIKGWFFDNYEDPVYHTPRDDGDWVYIWGGPYCTREIIEDAFGGVASDLEIDFAVGEIESEGAEWVVPSVGRIW